MNTSELGERMCLQIEYMIWLKLSLGYKVKPEEVPILTKEELKVISLIDLRELIFKLQNACRPIFQS